MASVDFNMHFEHVLVGCEVMGQGGTGYGHMAVAQYRLDRWLLGLPEVC